MSQSGLNELDELKSYKLRYDRKPLLMNELRGMHWAPYNDFIEDYRDTFQFLAEKVEKVPPMHAIEIIVHQTYSGTKPCDTVSCAPAAKAAIDGLKKAGVITDDSPTYVRNVTFTPPTKDRRDSMTLEIFEALT